MLKPRKLGWLVLVAVLMLRGLDALMGVLAGGAALFGDMGSSLSLFDVLSLLFVFSYTTGAIGLILWHRWGNTLLLLTGIGDIVSRFVPVVILLLRETSGPLGEEEPLLLGSHLAGLILPGAIAAASWWLREHPEAWTVFTAPRRLPWLKRLIWTILGTGFLLPVVVGLAVSLVQAWKGMPVVYLSEEAVWVGFMSACFVGPFLVLALIVDVSFREKLDLHGVDLARRLFPFIGAFAGITVLMAISLFRELYPWNMGNWEGLFFILLPFVALELAIPGAAVGLVIGRICFLIWQRTSHGGPAATAGVGTGG